MFGGTNQTRHVVKLGQTHWGMNVRRCFISTQYNCIIKIVGKVHFCKTTDKGKTSYSFTFFFLWIPVLVATKMAWNIPDVSSRTPGFVATTSADNCPRVALRRKKSSISTTLCILENIHLSSRSVNHTFAHEDLHCVNEPDEGTQEKNTTLGNPEKHSPIS